MTSKVEHDVFISYSSCDRTRVERVATYLRENGLKVWFDQWKIRPGDDIFATIEHGLQSSRTLILFLSASAIRSDWVALERNTTLFRDPLNRERRFVPVVLDSCRDLLPDTLRRYKHIDATKFSKTVYQEILDACQPQRVALLKSSTPPSWPYADVLEGKKILIAEDDADLVSAYCAVLEGTGATLECAYDGNEALDIQAEFNPDLIILDAMMPKRSGFLVLEKIKGSDKRKGQRPFVVMATQNEGRRHQTWAEGLGVDAYIIKPFRMERLIETIIRLLTARPELEWPPDLEIETFNK